MSRTASGKPRTAFVNRKRSNGDVYVYEVTSLYNPEKQYNENISSKLIGKIPSGSTEMVPTRPKKATVKEQNTKAEKAARKHAGTTDILEWIGESSGIDADIYASTDRETAQKAISVARFWTANPDKTLCGIEEWQIEHVFPYMGDFSEDVCSSLMEAIGYDASISQNYFRRRSDRAPKGVPVAVDSTTIYSYSENLNDALYGYNKDGNGMPAVKMLTLCDADDHQPIAYVRQPGNIPDGSSALRALKQFSAFGITKALMDLGGGFFSEENILKFIGAHTGFIMRGQLDCKWIRPELDSVLSQFAFPSSVCEDKPTVYGVTKQIQHKFENGGEYGLYLHFYYDTDKAEIQKDTLMNDILQVRKQLLEGVDYAMLSNPGKNIADKFLTIRKKNNSLKIQLNDKAILKEQEYYGYFVLVSDETLDKDQALQLYLLREKTEDGFRLDKQCSDAHAERSKLGASLDGRFFCQFLAMGYEAFFMKELSRVKHSLAVPNGDPAHDNPVTLKKEKALLDWLNKMTMAKIFDWFDASRETTVTTGAGKARWRADAVERDQLFLKKLGVI